MSPRLTDRLRVALYDAENAWAADDEFFLSVANEHPASRVLDLGCGTGRLSLAFAAAGHRVTGIDPDAAALATARGKPGADLVAWMEGTSSVIPAAGSFDAVFMTSHVAQAISDDDSWSRTLRDVRRALRPGGLFAFDSRDPSQRAWESWNRNDSRGTVELADGTRVDCWHEVTEVRGGIARFNEHTVFADGTSAVRSEALAFRPEAVLRANLATAGFETTRIYGGWHREPVGRGVGEFVVLARRLSTP